MNAKALPFYLWIMLLHANPHKNSSEGKEIIKILMPIAGFLMCLAARRFMLMRIKSLREKVIKAASSRK